MASCGEAVDADDPGPVVSSLVTCALDLQLVEMRDAVLGLMDRGWVDEDMVGDREHIAAQFGLLPRLPPQPPINDVAEAVKWRGCFKTRATGATGARARRRPAAALPRPAQSRPQRPGSVREQEEVQEVLWGGGEPTFRASSPIAPRGCERERADATGPTIGLLSFSEKRSDK